MGSKPPLSKAKKSKNKTAKKLPSNIAKRFKEKKIEREIDDKQWEDSVGPLDAISEEITELPIAKAAIALASSSSSGTNSGGKKKRNIMNNNRSKLRKNRDDVLGQLMNIYGNKH